MLTPFPNLTILDIPIGISPQIVMAVVAVLIVQFFIVLFSTRLSDMVTIKISLN
jgi:hypothetical protein